MEREIKNAVGISAIYDEADQRLKRKEEVVCNRVDNGGVVRRKSVKVTEAEKYLIEAIAMRLFLDHKKFIKKEKLDGGKVKLTAVISVEKR